jgi:hypothetical protein
MQLYAENEFVVCYFRTSFQIDPFGGAKAGGGMRGVVENLHFRKMD